MRLEGDRIFLTGIVDADTEDIVRWRNKDCVRKKFLYQGLFTNESHRNWMETMVATGKVVQFIIWEKSTMQKIGSVYLRDVDKINEKAEFGIFIGEEDKLSCGYGREAADLITEYGFKELGLHKIFLRVLADNMRAVKSYQKAGFVQEGVFKEELVLDGKRVDLIFMAKFAKE